VNDKSQRAAHLPHHAVLRPAHAPLERETQMPPKGPAGEIGHQRGITSARRERQHSGRADNATSFHVKGNFNGDDCTGKPTGRRQAVTNAIRTMRTVY